MSFRRGRKCTYCRGIFLVNLEISLGLWKNCTASAFDKKSGKSLGSPVCIRRLRTRSQKSPAIPTRRPKPQRRRGPFWRFLTFPTFSMFLLWWLQYAGHQSQFWISRASVLTNHNQSCFKSTGFFIENVWSASLKLGFGTLMCNEDWSSRARQKIKNKQS